MTIAKRPETRLDGLDSQLFTVAAGQTVRPGMGIKIAATDASPATADYPQAQEAIADTDDPIAIAAGELDATAYAAGEIFTGYLMAGGGVIPILVGTGGITRGLSAVCASDGFTNAPANGNGTTRIFSPGVALATGVVGDGVALLVKPRALAKT
jgi:hypothetical protein